MKRKYLAVTLIAVLAVSLIAGGVFAFLKARTDPVENSMTPATDPVISVEETMEENVKSEVCVNVGEPGYSVYVRAAVVVNWADEDGNILSVAPVEGTDYSIEYNTVDSVTAEKQWFEGADGFFYYSSPVVSGSTEALVSSCEPLQNSESGYHLRVEIVSQVIQALGSTDTTADSSDSVPAVTDAWGVTLNSSGLIISSQQN